MGVTSISEPRFQVRKFLNFGHPTYYQATLTIVRNFHASKGCVSQNGRETLQVLITSSLHTGRYLTRLHCTCPKSEVPTTPPCTAVSTT